MYLFEHHACPPKDGAEKIDLRNEEHRFQLQNEIVSRAVGLDLSNLNDTSKPK